jgi:hypothetical protein
MHGIKQPMHGMEHPMHEIEQPMHEMEHSMHGTTGPMQGARRPMHESEYPTHGMEQQIHRMDAAFERRGRHRPQADGAGEMPGRLEVLSPLSRSDDPHLRMRWGAGHLPKSRVDCATPHEP